jgi:two-component system sensor histidine kinase AlgZ
MDKQTDNRARPSAGDQGFLPNFCTIRNLFMTVLTAELLAIMFTLSAETSATLFAQTLSLLSLYIQWITLMGIALLCGLRPWLQRLSDTLAGITAWLILLATTLVVAELAFYLLNQASSPLGIDSGDHRGFVLRSLGISAITCALGLRYLYIQHQWRQQEIAESQARLQALQSRIRPHFLFNSMNTIASLTRSRPEVAEEVVHDLADLFRASLAEARTLSTLGEELELARGYLRIEALRLGERLQVAWELEQIPEEATLPQLILQPLLENAVYHGIEPAPEGGRIHIAAHYKRPRITISIRNSLPPANSISHREGNRLAIENIRQRLEGVFGREAGLSASESGGEYQVQLFFPHPWETA